MEHLLSKTSALIQHGEYVEGSGIEGILGISLAVNSSIAAMGNIAGAKGSSSQSRSYFGPVAVGYIKNDAGNSRSGIQHMAMEENKGGYALFQNQYGSTHINSALDKQIHFRIDDLDKMVVTGDGTITATALKLGSATLTETMIGSIGAVTAEILL